MCWDHLAVETLKTIERGEKNADRSKGLRIVILDEECNLHRSLSSVYWLLHRLGYSDLKPRPPTHHADSVPAVFARTEPG